MGEENKLNSAPNRRIDVFCRLRGGQTSLADDCVTIFSPTEIQISRSDSRQSSRYKFRRVFGRDASQKCVFDNVAFHLVQELLLGKNGLLFAYGVTGSGKTFTMTGTREDAGIMPRCLDGIFNSIEQFQAEKYIFKPDKLNGFEVQSELDARTEREHACLKNVAQRKIALAAKNNLKNGSEDDLLGRSRDTSRVAHLNEDNSYAVFVTYVEIYNNNVYDLLEDFHSDFSKPRPLQSKIVREDPLHNMYVHGITEVEVSSTEEAFEVFFIGQKRKHVAQTTLNNESSRAHTIFNIRVVQAPLTENDESIVDKSLISVSQLSLVDLAGTERSVRTKTRGQRLREAGNINNSLMTLRVCLENLRDNQNGGNKIIPYRESRLTHLFKNYFDGDGQVSMIICVSPSIKDLDETIHALKFAEMSQEIQLPQKPVRARIYNTPVRRQNEIRFIEAMKEQNAIVKDPPSEDDDMQSSSEGSQTAEVQPLPRRGIECKTALNMFLDAPSVAFVDHDDDNIISGAINYWENKLESWNNLTNNVNKKYMEFRDVLARREREHFLVAQEIKSVKSLYDIEKNKTAELESKTREMTSGINELKRKLNDFEFNEKKLKRQLGETKLELGRMKVDYNNIKELMKSKVRDTEERLNQEFERKLHCQKNTIYELKRKDRKLKEVRRIVGNGLDSGSKTPSIASLAGSSDDIAVTQTPKQNSKPDETPSASPVVTTPRNYQMEPSSYRSTVRNMGIPVSNRRHRRSRSADVWLDHRPAIAVPLTTVLQPKMEKRKSITKLTQAKDVMGKTSKYCLMTQAQDSDGDIETRLYKADVIPTSGGGAQVMFSDIEVLKQMSPTQSPRP